MKSKLNILFSQKINIIRLILISIYLVTISYGAYSLYKHKDEIYFQAMKNAQDKAILMQEELLSTLTRMDIILDDAIEKYTDLMTGKQQIDMATVNINLEKMMKRLPEAQKHSLRLIDKNGDVVYSASDSAVFQKFSVRERDYFNILQDNKDSGLVFSKPVKSKISGNYVVPLNKRISYPDGAFAGFATVAINTEYLSQLFEKLNLESYSMIAVYDSNFNIVGRYPHPEKNIGKQVIIDEIKDSLENNQTSGIYSRFARVDGVYRNYYFSKVPEYPFIVLIGISPDDYLSDWRREVYIFIVFSIIGAIVFLILERLLTKLEKEKLIMLQQARLASVGEMIGNIAHQWRQPLNTLAIRIQEILFAFKSNEITEEYLHEFKNTSMELIEYMSKTIDDFRNFFKPDKEKMEFDIKDAIKSTLSILQDAMKSSCIKINLNISDDKLIILGYKNEFTQVLVNILNNAKDAIQQNNNDNNRFINIKAYNENSKVNILISDNAGGIPTNIIDKIFDPYFTTKHASQGTGLGLYMSKMIIEENMDGKLSVENIDGGACFLIEINANNKTLL
ncbi:MAG: hypothetical protein RL154_126 [Pseudomonadota bacterium]|jgi:signal transduction histidine kinase